MSEQEVRDFSAGMGWDDMEDPGILRDLTQTFAETDPESFIKMVNSGTLTYRAVAKRALDKQVLIYIPLENKIIWGENQQVLAVLPSQVDGDLKTHIELFADWLLAAKDGEKTYKILKTLLGSK
jgi:hypothetical protein